MLSLSTCWFRDHSMRTEDILAEVRRLGFRAIEWAAALHHDEAVIAAAVRAGDVAVSSVHAVTDFHTVPGISSWTGDVGSSDAAHRLGTVEALCLTVERARRLGARAVVLHAGGLSDTPLRKRWSAFLKRWNLEGPTDELREELAAIHRQRESESPAYIERTVRSVTDVLRRVGEFPIGLETPYNSIDFPLPHELEHMWREIGSDCVGYWHDMGHAHMQQLFSDVSELSWFDRYGDRVLGVHLHDAIGTSDHRPPGTGELPLAEVARRVAHRDIPCVIEVGTNYDTEDMLAAREFLESLGLR
ncbi:MAG: sugar phosphate isomerase/epimerase [Planctomycetes bacterium]|nr:sugar phosphate isomerase/epimerase [Planctomycetota bacterium]